MEPPAKRPREEETDVVLVLDLPSEIDEVRFRQIFGSYGIIRQVEVVPLQGQGKNGALARYSTVQEAAWLVENLNGNVPSGLRDPVKIRFSSKLAGKVPPSDAPPPPAPPAAPVLPFGVDAQPPPMAALPPPPPATTMAALLQAPAFTPMPALLQPPASTPMAWLQPPASTPMAAPLQLPATTPMEALLQPSATTPLSALLQVPPATLFQNPPATAMAALLQPPAATPMATLLAQVPGCGVGGALLGCGGCGGAVPFNPDVEAFLISNNIQGDAAEQFRQLPAPQQQMVAGAGSLHEAKDPAAVLMKRIALVKVTSNARPQSTVSPAGGTRTMLPGDWFCPGCSAQNIQRNTTCAQCGRANPNSTTATEVEMFLSQPGLEAHAKDKFHLLDSEKQKVVIEQGSLSTAHCPTSCLIARINWVKKEQSAKAKEEAVQPATPTAALLLAQQMGLAPLPALPGATDIVLMLNLPQQVNEEMFRQIFGPYRQIQQCEVSPCPGQGKAFALFRLASSQDAAWFVENLNGNIPLGLVEPVVVRTASAEEATWFLQKHGRATATSPCVGAMANMPAAGGFSVNQLLQMGDVGAGGGCAAQVDTAHVAEVESYLATNSIRPDAAQQFRQLSTEQQHLVAGAGSLADARDPSGVLVKRMNLVTKAGLNFNQTPSVGDGGCHPGAGGQKPGDWYCPQCTDLQFAKNTQCRRCGAQNPILHGPPPGPVYDFLNGYTVQQHALEQFYGLKRELQQHVMDRGSLAGSWDASAVVIGRVKQAMEECKGKGKCGGWCKGGKGG